MFDKIPVVIFVEIGFSLLLGFVSLTPTYEDTKESVRKIFSFDMYHLSILVKYNRPKPIIAVYSPTRVSPYFLGDTTCVVLLIYWFPKKANYLFLFHTESQRAECFF